MRDRDETLLKAGASSFETFDEASERLLPTISARLWEVCCWGEELGEGWEIGDFGYLILSLSPEKGVEIYVQYWSEPQEIISAEVSSGEPSPGTLKYVRRAQRDYLAAHGYAIGGGARNFQKEVRVADATDAESVAEEALRILYEGFGYRGQWTLTLKVAKSTRAVREWTHTSVTPEDLAKVAVASGVAAQIHVAEDSDDAVVLLKHGRRQFVAWMEDRVPGNNLYTLVALRASLRPGRTVSDLDLLELASRMRRIHLVRVPESDEIGAYMGVSLSGGVTTSWLAEQLSTFYHALKYTESALRKRTGRSGVKRTARVH